MRFKISLLDEPKHKDVVSGVTWVGSDEVLSFGDDHQLLQWNLLTGESSLAAELTNVYPTEFHWLPKGGAQRTKTNPDTFLVTSSDGKFYIINKLGRIEKSVEAHRGACLTGKWSHDGNALLTAGEDGLVKTWSRSGMLRSSIAQVAVPVYSAAWSPDADAVLYTSGSSLIIKPLTPNSKPTQWKAHEGIILKVAWDLHSGRILSGGEDGRYRVWDSYGRQVFTSGLHHYPITALAWSPDGQLFAVGSHNTIRLCDKAGWCHSMEKPNTGSIFNLSWSDDGTQVAGACGNGHVLFAHVIKRHLEWQNYEATTTTKSTISLRNVANDAKEKLEFRDRVIKLSMCYNHMIVVTSTQAYVYSTRNWNTPVIIDLKENNVSLILQAEKHFLLVDGGSIIVYSYEGRLICSPKSSALKVLNTSDQLISISNDTLAVRSKLDEKAVHFFDALSGKDLTDGKPWMHKVEAKVIALDQVGTSKERKLAVLDRNNDLFILPVQRVGGMGREVKLGGMIHSIRWSENTNQLAGIHDSTLSVWFYPAVAFVDRDLLPLTMWQKDDFQRYSSNMTAHSRSSDLGKNAEISGFADNLVIIRRMDGSVAAAHTSPYPALLHSYVIENKWNEALRLARFIKEDFVWGCLAGLAINGKQLETAEVAYAAISRPDKVGYIQHIKEMPSKEVQKAEMALLGGHISEAENLLLQAGLYFRAILLNINGYQWERALQLALKHKMHLDIVLAYRMRYLSRFGKKETNKLFIQHGKDIEINWEKIQEKLREEYSKEGSRPT